MSHKILITVLIGVTALRMDLPRVSATSAPDEVAFFTNDDWDEQEYPADESEFPDADNWEVVESEVKPAEHSYCTITPTVCVRLGSLLFRESNSFLHFSLGSFDIVDRLRL